MNVKRIASAFAGLLFGIFSGAATATILQVSGGILTGAKYVNVNGGFYDVTFQKGSCQSLYSGCDDNAIEFSDLATAQAAAAALLAFVFVDGPDGNFDSDPTKTFGCSFANNCLSRIAYDHNDTSISPQVVVVNDNPDNVGFFCDFDCSFTETLPSDADTNFSNVNFATFTKSVPLPGSLPLLGIGIAAGLGFRRGKRVG